MDELWWCQSCGGEVPAGDVDHEEIRDEAQRLIAEVHTHLALDGPHEVKDLNSEEHWGDS